MVMVYVNRIKAGTWTINQVPALWREAVRAKLEANNG